MNEAIMKYSAFIYKLKPKIKDYHPSYQIKDKLWFFGSIHILGKL